jgi:hypothetical protein
VTRAILIAGAQRSGSTLLGILLGRHPQVTNLGETRRLPLRWAEDAKCGCGVGMQSCPFWTAINQRLDLANFGPNMARDLYDHATTLQGTSMVVDVSKSGGYVEEVQGGDDLVIHLIRDPRALALSRHRRARGDNPRPPIRDVVVGSMAWSKANLRARHAAREASGLTMLYESLASDPDLECGRVWSRLGVAPVDGSWGTQHFTGGNLRVKKRGEVEVRVDDEWQTVMPATHKIVGYLFGLPMSAVAGYKLLKG